MSSFFILLYPELQALSGDERATTICNIFHRRPPLRNGIFALLTRLDSIKAIL